MALQEGYKEQLTLNGQLSWMTVVLETLKNMAQDLDRNFIGDQSGQFTQSELFEFETYKTILENNVNQLTGLRGFMEFTNKVLIKRWVEKEQQHSNKMT